MTDYVLAEKGLSRSRPLFGSITDMVHNWQTRRRLLELLDREDRILDDIGVTRDDVIWAASLPLTVNRSLALDDEVRRRRKTR